MEPLALNLAPRMDEALQMADLMGAAEAESPGKMLARGRRACIFVNSFVHLLVSVPKGWPQ